jgi:hypothetical protein
MAESAESNRPTLVKPRSTWGITSKTSPMNPIEPLDQVYTHPWSTLGQRRGPTRLNLSHRRMSPETFAAFSKFHLNTSKSTFMKVVHLVEGHTFYVDCISNFGWKRGKTWSTVSISCFPKQGDIQSWQDVPAKSVEKNIVRPLWKL